MRRITILQGEQAVVREPGVTLVTVLGSCIAVCLHSPAARAGGMNHFLLGQPEGEVRATGDERRFGVHAMELLINALLEPGVARIDLRAHLYGGATIIAGLGDIGRRNIAFARSFLQTEGIPISHEDVGGREARRVEFLAHEGRSRSRLARQLPPAPSSHRSPFATLSGELELF